MITRRCLPAAASLALTPAGARAQRRLPVVAFVGFASFEGDRVTVAAFRDGMRAQG
jgi:hypothetical protein